MLGEIRQSQKDKYDLTHVIREKKQISKGNKREKQTKKQTFNDIELTDGYQKGGGLEDGENR